jgi:hypothetical protein
MIAQSQSGTGKTAAFALTILSRINYELKAPQVYESSITYPLRRIKFSGKLATMISSPSLMFTHTMRLGLGHVTLA